MAVKIDKLFYLIKKHLGVDRDAIISRSDNYEIRQARIMNSALMSHVLKMEHIEIAKVIDRTQPSVTYHTKQHYQALREDENYRLCYERIKGDYEDFEDIEEIDREPDVKALAKEILNLNRRLTLIEAKL